MADGTPPPRLVFRKMHGLGNDFVILDRRTQGAPATPALVRALADRRRGVGCDTVVELSADAEADAAVRFWNADGSVSGACGNATRCVADLLAEDGRRGGVLRTGRGALAWIRRDDGLISVNMGAPALDWAEVPLAEAADTAALPLPGAPGAVGMGNPHLVFFVADAEATDPAADGPGWETHPMFPERTNVEFVEVLAPDRLRMRVWERGVGVTQACGSGACAAVVAGARKGLCDRRATVALDGGALEIDWREDGVWMTGPAARAFDGVWTGPLP